MKFFWLLLALIVVAAGTMYFVGGAVDHGSKSPKSERMAAELLGSEPSAAVSTPAKAAGDVAAAQLKDETATGAAAAASASSAPTVSADPSRENPTAVDHVVREAAPATPPSAAPAAAPAAETPAAPKLPAPENVAPAASAPSVHSPETSLADDVLAAATPKTAEGDTIIRQDDAIKIVKKADGQMLVDDRYALKGEGSEAAPYEITWEYLVSAQETYDPKKGKKKVPERLAMLDGKRVRITGYIAFPLMAQSPKELLAMLNQWDGCCIGVPPTPYDAIEVRLKDAATQEQKFTNYGSVEGTFQVKPYVVGEWLVGLYVMNGAQLSSKGSGVGT